MNYFLNNKWKWLKWIGIICLMIYFSWNMWQVFNSNNLESSLQFIQMTCANNYFYYLSVVFGFMVLTYAVEAFKWLIIIKLFQKPNYLSCLKAIIVSQLFAINTPARSGDFIGKIYFLEDQHKLKGVFLSFYGNFAQMSLVCFLGFWSLILYKNFNSLNISIINQYYNLFLGLSILLSFGLLFLFYKYNILINLLKKLKIKWIQLELKDLPTIPLTLSHKIMIISLLRLVVTLCTYFFLFYIFFKNYNSEILILITLYLFAIYFLPTFHFFDVIVRGSLGVYIFSSIPNINPIIIVTITSTVWFFNIFFPALIGFFIFGFHQLKQKWLSNFLSL